MSNRIPPSLAWLAKKRARLSGRIDQLGEDLVNYRKLLERTTISLDKARADLAAVDRTILLHEIPVNPELIPPVRPQRNPLSFPNGEFRGTILDLLRASEQPLVPRQLARMLVENRKVQLTVDSRPVLLVQIRYALKSLRRQGYIKRADEGKGRNAKWVAISGVTRRLRRPHYAQSSSSGR